STNPYVIAVSAAYQDATGKWKSPTWATTGDSVRAPDLLAPGVSVMSLRDPGSRVDREHPEGRVPGDDRLFLGSGTSQATAVVSGAAALLLQQRPGLTPDQVKSLLVSSAADISGSKFVGRGVVDLTNALTQP